MNSLPAGALNILATANPDESVTFIYAYGSGKVLDSSIPLDYYLDGNGDSDAVIVNMVSYAENVVKYEISVEPVGVPTLGQWTMIILSLLVFIFGIASYKRKESSLAFEA